MTGIKTEEIGIPFLYGIDKWGNKIYVQGMGGSDRIVINLLKDIMALYGDSGKGDIVGQCPGKCQYPG